MGDVELNIYSLGVRQCSFLNLERMRCRTPDPKIFIDFMVPDVKNSPAYFLNRYVSRGKLAPSPRVPGGVRKVPCLGGQLEGEWVFK